MDKDWEYVSLSKRFQSFAARATDPNLAAAYRTLAEHYRVLDKWRQRVADRYESVAAPPDGTTEPEGSTAPPPPRRRKPP